jgi:hypothetical protein
MAANSSSSSRTGTDESDKRERMLSMVGGALGILMFLFGFLRWLKFDSGGTSRKYSGFAFQMPTTAIIGLSLAAGLIALLGATEHRRGRGVPSAIPTGLAATSLLLAIGVFLGKGAISPDIGDKVGVEIGLILGLLTALVQTIVLAMGLSSRRDENDHDTVGRSGQRV